MSKYNLIDIYEQYQIGSGWTNDFDYDGMLNTGLGTSIDTPIEVLKKIFEDFTDVNYHREAEHLSYAIDALEDGDAFEAEGKISDFHDAIRKTMEGFDMDVSDDLGAFMASKMDLDEDKDKKDKDKEPRDGVKSAASKLGMKPSHIKEGVWNMPSADELDEFVAYMEDAKERFYHIGSDDVHDGLESAITAAKQLLNMQLKEE